MELKRSHRTFRSALTPLIMATGSTDQTATAGRVLLQAIDLPTRCKLIGMTISNGTTVAGNVTVGIYGPITTNFSPSGESLVATSADTALTGSLAPQTISFTTTPIVQPGQYYIAAEFSNVTHQYRVALGSSATIASSRGRFDQSYGALPATFPALTNSSFGSFIAILQVESIQ